MREDLAEFASANARPAADWRQHLHLWGLLAWESAADLARRCPQEDCGIFAAASELLVHLHVPAHPTMEPLRKPIARLCGYLNASANLLANFGLAPHDTDAIDSAREVAYAAVQMLVAMNEDFGADEHEAPDDAPDHQEN